MNSVDPRVLAALPKRDRQRRLNARKAQHMLAVEAIHRAASR